MKRSIKFKTGWLGLLAFGGAVILQAQPVAVTLSLETNRISLGQTTTLHVLAQIIPENRPNTDRIFSWYVDLINTNTLVAAPRFTDLAKAASDRDPRTSSTGVTDGAYRRGIYDTFINLSGAGRNAPVELFSLPVTGSALGWTTFRVQAGTGVPNLMADFIVAPAGGGDPLLGGNYSAASVQLEVVAASTAVTNLVLHISAAALPGGAGQRLTLSYPVVSGHNYQVQYSDAVKGANTVWQPLPGAPHNSGTVLDTNTAPKRFYRVQAAN